MGNLLAPKAVKGMFCFSFVRGPVPSTFFSRTLSKKGRSGGVQCGQTIVNTVSDANSAHGGKFRKKSGNDTSGAPFWHLLGYFWGTLRTFGPLCGFSFSSSFSGPEKGAVVQLWGLWCGAGAGGGGALAGGGVPFQVTLVRLAGRKFHTPSGQAWPGAADLKASPLPPAPLR